MSDKKSLLGCVKWFNNKVGYGFITLSDGSSEQDIFVHHSALNTSDEQYKYLVQGEYVCFELVKSSDPDSKHEFFAGNVSGVNGGKLMCETRNQIKGNSSSIPKKGYSRSSRDEYRTRDDREYDYRPRSSRPRSSY
jgi:cold shock CspA family protein